MNRLLQRMARDYMTPPPMPIEALPDDLVSRTKIGRAVFELAWQAMGYQMFLNGVGVGAVTTVVVFSAIFLGILFRVNIRAILVKVLTSGIA